MTDPDDIDEDVSDQQSIIEERSEKYARVGDVLKEKIANVIKNFEEGQLVEGTVTTLTNYGAFINLGDYSGLLHASDMSWRR